MGHIARIIKRGEMMPADEPGSIREVVPLQQRDETDEDLVLTGLTEEVPV